MGVHAERLCAIKDTDVVIVDAVRTPIGQFLRSLKDFSAAELGGLAVKGLLDRTNLDIKKIDEVIMGNVIQAGNGQNPARQAAVLGGTDYSVNAYTVNMVCGSGLKAVTLAAQSVMTGDSKLVVAGGMESMSRSPYVMWGLRSGGHKAGDVGTSEVKGFSQEETLQFKIYDSMIHDGLLNCDCYGNDKAVHMGTLAEDYKDKYGISESDVNQFARQSNIKASKAIDEGRFKKEVVPVKLINGSVMENDEGPRPDTTPEKIRSLKKVFKENGVLNAGNSSQISDGASAVLVTNYQTARELGLRPKAKITGYVSYSHEPENYGTAPAYGIEKLLTQTGTRLSDYGLLEVNEAFSIQVLAVKKILMDKYNDDISDRLNVNGGAIALGHPIGASGARILTTLLYAMEDRRVRKGLASLCIGGGSSVSLAVELL